MTATTATQLARSVVRALLDAGVTEVVIAPGSRNAPLSFAAYDAANAGLLRLHTRIDERTAGFVGLGLTKVGARAAVMCTSGTAVANLHPAVLESAHAAVPLVVVSADRPARLRGTNANQTTDQVGVFGPLVETHDLDGGSPVPAFAAAGPTHLNVQLDDPLVPDDNWLPGRGVGTQPDHVQQAALVALRTGPRTVVVAGDDAGPPARQLAEQANWPLFAEPTSGARTGANALQCYRVLLDSDLGRSIERVVVFGHPTLSRPVAQLLRREDVEVFAAPVPGVWSRPPFELRGEPERVHMAEEPDDPAWLEEWRAADRSVSGQLDRLLRDEPDLTPYEAVGAVSRALPAGGLLFVGASSPIRDLDLMARPSPVRERRRVIANRGLSGIDGTVSSAMGAALGRPQGTRNLALMGDVTFLHDSVGLVLGPGEARPDLTIVVVNDDGGSIFSMLEQGDPSHATAFDKLFGTPHGADLASLCAATRTPHWPVEHLAELEQALASPNGGIEVVEVRVRRDTRRELDARLRALRP